MSGETDRLLNLAKKLSKTPYPRELDVLLATGEQVSIALLTMALIDKACPAISYTGSQVRILTDNVHTKARILEIDDTKIKTELNAGRIVVIAGFQGIDEEGNITTLGRGGSDTTAVALASAINADECQIFTDVEGVYTADPKIVPNASCLPRISVEEMLEMASSGAKVMQIRAVELAGKYSIPVRVLSSFQDGLGTLISDRQKMLEYPLISGVTFNRDEAKWIIQGLQDKPGVASDIFGALSDAHIEVDMIVQTHAKEGLVDLAFTVHRRDHHQSLTILDKVLKVVGAQSYHVDATVAKLSLVGLGIRSHANISSCLFETLGKMGINIQLISTSEIKVSVVIDEKYLEQGVHALHEACQLGMEPNKIAAVGSM
jgi:aspartate kinase